MGITLIIIGLGCMIAALIGGGVKLVQLEIAKFTSGRRQAALGVLGLVIFLIGLAIDQQPKLASSGGDQGNMAGPAPGPAVVNQSAAPPADPKPVEPPPAAQPSTPAPAADLTGLWLNNAGEVHQFWQQGNQFNTTVASTAGPLYGSGSIQGDRVAWMVGPVRCEGTLMQDRRSMVMMCAGPQGGGQVILARQ